jgi:hypothetical protein
MSKPAESNTLLPSAPFLSKAVQGAPLAFIICVWVFVYNEHSRHNQSFIKAIYALAWITLILAVYNLYATVLELIKIPSDPMLLSKWALTLAYIVYIFIFICICIGAFANDGKNVHKYIKFLQVGSWFYFFGFIIVPTSLDLGMGFIKSTTGEVRDSIQDIKSMVGLKGQKKQQVPIVNQLF